MANTSILTTQCKVRAALNFATQLAANRNWLFVGDYIPHTNNDKATDYSIGNTFITPWKNMVMGKIVNPSNIYLGIENKPYVSNTVWAMYDNIDQDLVYKNYYCIVNSSEIANTDMYYVFKCLDNNQNSVSTTPPDVNQQAISNTIIYETADGYVWKFMYAVDANTANNFSSTKYFPLIANTQITAAAVNGAIDIVKVEYSGSHYSNFLTNQSFNASNIKVNGQPLLYTLNNANTALDFYTGCILYITGGAGAGQYKTITSNYTSGGSTYITVDSDFAIPVTTGSTFEIYPQVIVIGDGNQSINCVARAIVNASGNTIQRVEVLRRGQGFINATAYVSVSSSVSGVVNAAVRPIISPPGGHGADVAAELGANNVIVGVTLSNTESGTILASNVMYQQIGLIQNPVFTSAELTLSGVTGQFSDATNENISVINTYFIATNCSINTTSNILTSSGGTSFDTQLSPNIFLYLADSSNANNNQLVTVNSVTNSTSLLLNSNGLFNSTNTVNVYMGLIKSNMILDSVQNSTVITVASIQGVVNTGSIIVGLDSGSTATVSSMKRSNVSKTFDTFIQLYKYSVVVQSGSFSNGELVSSGAITGTIHTNDSNTTFYIGNMTLPFQPGQTIRGLNGQALITGVTAPELSIGSGDIFYVENIDAITRQSTQNETFVLTFNF